MKLGCGYPMGPVHAARPRRARHHVYVAEVMFDEFREAALRRRRRCSSGWSWPDSSAARPDAASTVTTQVVSPGRRRQPAEAPQRDDRWRRARSSGARATSAGAGAAWARGVRSTMRSPAASSRRPARNWASPLALRLVERTRAPPCGLLQRSRRVEHRLAARDRRRDCCVAPARSLGVRNASWAPGTTASMASSQTWSRPGSATSSGAGQRDRRRHADRRRPERASPVPTNRGAASATPRARGGERKRDAEGRDDGGARRQVPPVRREQAGHAHPRAHRPADGEP